MIKKILRNIRQKPKAVREQYAFWIACVLTSLVALVWVTTTVGEVEIVAESANTEAVTPTESSSLSNFLDGAQKQINAAQQELQSGLPANEANDSATETNPVASTATTAPTAVSTPGPVITTGRPVRIATTSAASTSDQNLNE